MGQDECIFKQYLFNPKQWVLPDGTRPLLPKDEGQGTMVSAFCLREFGFGLNLTKEELVRVNVQRSGKKYIDETAARAIYGRPEKPNLLDSPFVRHLEYGQNNEGYWMYDHMIVQLEDCVDVLKVLYPDFDFLFLFDHSNGHDRQCDDALNANKMNRGFSGAVPAMQNTTIESDDYLGPFESKLVVGQVQNLVYQPGDEGPFYLSPEERLAMRIDRVRGTKERPLKKS